MPYIGVSPQFGVRKKHTYTATAGQTSFSGAGSEGVTLSYKDSNYVDVYQNGIKLGDADYTSTSGTAIVLAQGASVDDLVEIIVFDVFSISDTVSKADGGTFDGDITVSGAFTSKGIDDNANATAITIDSNKKIGIGATTIDSDIHIEKASDLEIKLERTGSGTSTIGVPSSGQLEINNTSNAAMTFSTNNSEVMRLTNGGQMGLGTTTTEGKLTVGVNTTSSDGIYINNAAAGGGELDIASLGTSYSAHGAGAGEVWFYSSDNINIGGATGNTNDIKFLAAGGERVRIDGGSDNFIKVNGAYVYFRRGSVNNNASVSIDIPAISSAGATMVFAFYSHHAIQNYGAARVSTLGMYSGSVVSTHDIQNITSSGGGSFTYSSPGSNVLRITKNAGTYIGGGHYVIRVETYIGN